MRLIIPIILIALLLPYATGEDSPTGEWLIPPDATTGVSVVASNAAGAPDAPDASDTPYAPAMREPDAAGRTATTQPTMQPLAVASASFGVRSER